MSALLALLVTLLAVPAPQPMPGGSASWPVLRTALPPSVPADDAGLPDLLADPPGRARMVYHPAEHIPGPGGWASETLLFHGTDGQWRRLGMDDLGLPESSWPGPDTYGAGRLSPDGHWWAGRSRAGVIVLDLGTGRVEVVDLGTRWVASIEWTDDHTMVVGHGAPRLRTARIAWPSAEHSALPYPYWQVPRLSEGRMLVTRQRHRGLELAVLDPAGVAVDARLHVNPRQRVRYVDSEWLDPRTVLMHAGSGLLAWRPGTGRFWQLTRLPDPAGGYASVDVATGLP